MRAVSFWAEKMINVILILIVVVIAFFAIRFVVKRIQGKAGCCGGGECSVMVEPKPIKKITDKKEILIDGMKCKNCSTKVQNALNSLPNVNATVKFKKKSARIKIGEGVSDELLRQTIENCGYNVVQIKEI